MFLSLFLVFTSAVTEAQSTIVRDGPNLVVKDFSITGEIDYYSGDQVLQQINLSLTDDVGTIEESYIEVKIPKKSFEIVFNVPED